MQVVVFLSIVDQGRLWDFFPCLVSLSVHKSLTKDRAVLEELQVVVGIWTFFQIRFSVVLHHYDKERFCTNPSSLVKYASAAKYHHLSSQGHSAFLFIFMSLQIIKSSFHSVNTECMLKLEKTLSTCCKKVLFHRLSSSTFLLQVCWTCQLWQWGSFSAGCSWKGTNWVLCLELSCPSPPASWRTSSCFCSLAPSVTTSLWLGSQCLTMGRCCHRECQSTTKTPWLI